MSGVNFATLLGHVGADPEIRDGKSGKVATFSLATSESWRDKTSGERRQRTEWHRVVIFSERLVTLAESYVRKGSKLYLRGAIRTRKYKDKDGVERWATEIVLSGFQDDIQLLDRKEGTRPGPAEGLDEYGTERVTGPLADPPPQAGEGRIAQPAPGLDPGDEIPF